MLQAEDRALSLLLMSKVSIPAVGSFELNSKISVGSVLVFVTADTDPEAISRHQPFIWPLF